MWIKMRNFTHWAFYSADSCQTFVSVCCSGLYLWLFRTTGEGLWSGSNDRTCTADSLVGRSRMATHAISEGFFLYTQKYTGTINCSAHNTLSILCIYTNLSDIMQQHWLLYRMANWAKLIDFVHSWWRPMWPERLAISCLIDWFCWVSRSIH